MELHACKIIAKRTVGEFAGGIADEKMGFSRDASWPSLGTASVRVQNRRYLSFDVLWGHGRHAEQRRFSKHSRGFVSQITWGGNEVQREDKATFDISAFGSTGSNTAGLAPFSESAMNDGAVMVCDLRSLILIARLTSP